MSDLKCDTKLLDRLIRQVEGGDKTARVGFFEDSGEHPRSHMTAYEIALINNYGSVKANIPERPFVTDGAYERELVAQADLRKGVRQVHQGKKTFSQALSVAAETQKDSIAAQLQLAKFVYAGNAPSTVENKGFNAPMFESGWLYQKIDIKYD